MPPQPTELIHVGRIRWAGFGLVGALFVFSGIAGLGPGLRGGADKAANRLEAHLRRRQGSEAPSPVATEP